jgi:hypothetical protein
VRSNGTIYRTVFDGQGRLVSEWIGDVVAQQPGGNGKAI